MKRVLSIVLTLIVLTMVLSACSSSPSTGKQAAVDADLLTAFDSGQEDAAKLLNVTFEDQGTSAVASKEFNWCGRKMETQMPYVSGVAFRFEASDSFPMGKDVQTYVDDCFAQLKEQFGEPIEYSQVGFPDENGNSNQSGGEYSTGDAANLVQDFWDDDSVKALQFRFALDKKPSEDAVGARTVECQFVKDAPQAENVEVRFVLYDMNRMAEAMAG